MSDDEQAGFAHDGHSSTARAARNYAKLVEGWQLLTG
jgi:hypothetical protein